MGALRLGRAQVQQPADAVGTAVPGRVISGQMPSTEILFPS